MATRLSTLAEVKVLSLSTILYRLANNSASDVDRDLVSEALQTLKSNIIDPSDLQTKKTLSLTGGGGEVPIFKTIGIARSIRIDEDYGTQNIYGIGAPTRPRIVPNNFSVNISVERLQLDTRDMHHYSAKPDYWYSKGVQRAIGIDDILLYTFLFIRSKEENDRRTDIYAVMPRSTQRAVTSGDVMIAHSVNMVGFKYSYEESFFDTTTLIDESLTELIPLPDAAGVNYDDLGGELTQS